MTCVGSQNVRISQSIRGHYRTIKVSQSVQHCDKLVSYNVRGHFGTFGHFGTHQTSIAVNGQVFMCDDTPFRVGTKVSRPCYVTPLTRRWLTSVAEQRCTQLLTHKTSSEQIGIGCRLRKHARLHEPVSLGDDDHISALNIFLS